MNTISIRPYKSSDTPVLIKLFRDAIHAINIKHYSPEQVAAWAPDNIDENKWRKELSEMIVFVAEINGEIVGFSDITRKGYLDHLYIHKDYQGRFIAVHLLRAIEKAARELGLSKITTDCSITAKLPAERMGFRVIREQTVEFRDTKFVNYHMEKKLA